MTKTEYSNGVMKMTRSNFDIVRGLMCKDNSLESWICETEATLKRDLTVQEENAYIQSVVDECQEVMQELSCSLIEAYKDIME